MRDTGESVAEYDAFAFCDIKIKSSLVHYAVTRKRDDAMFRSLVSRSGKSASS